MRKTKTETNKQINKKENNPRSPFKDVEIFEKEIQSFANRFRTNIVNQTKRISDYFEMSCFNYIVMFYEMNEFSVEVKNLQSGKYRYKCTPSGIQSNFSFFEVSIWVAKKKLSFEIQHNLAIQSSHDNNVYTTPDISIIKAKSIKYTKEYYDANKTFSYVENEDLITFCEVKQFNPFPELIFNFIGVLNELKKEYMINKGKIHKLSHIAPSLMISGKPTKQTLSIKNSLEKRYCINIIFDLFYSAALTFSRSKVHKIKKAGRN